MIVDSAHLDASIGKALMESIKNINELEVSNLQNSLLSNEITCRLTLLPTSLLPGKAYAAATLYLEKKISAIRCFFLEVN
uniref:Synergin gamma C-terminal domain-containing protein n=1 Tax=Arundo donax TaxID=35708 RepID=A0A0A9CVX7_ARUDO